MVEAGEQPDVRVATPDGIERAKNVPHIRYPTHKKFLGETVLAGNGELQREADKAWFNNVIDAVGTSYQSAWDMDSYLEFDGDSQRLFLGRDATIYIGLHCYAGQIKTPNGAVIPCSPIGHHSISACMELSDDIHNAIELALATLVVRRKLTI